MLSTVLTWIFAVVAAASDTWFEGNTVFSLGDECYGGGGPCARCECRSRKTTRPTPICLYCENEETKSHADPPCQADHDALAVFAIRNGPNIVENRYKCR